MKPFTTVAVVVFAVICLAHILRLIFGWEASMNHTEIPVWVSIIGALVSGLLAVMLWKENK
jgi:hypothetical protein